MPAASFADPAQRALAIFLAGMALLLLIDIAAEPNGAIGQNRAIDSALSAATGALAEVTDPADDGGIPAVDTDAREADDTGSDEPGALQRRERAQSAAFFVEQAGLAWRRGEGTTAESLQTEGGAAAVLAFLGKLWVLGWLLLPLGALAARISCPRMEGRHPRWAFLYGATALGGSAALIALALAIYELGANAPFVLAPLVSAILVLNAWVLQDHARLDRTASLLRLAPILVILTVGLIFARKLLIHLAILP